MRENHYIICIKGSVFTYWLSGWVSVSSSIAYSDRCYLTQVWHPLRPHTIPNNSSTVPHSLFFLVHVNQPLCLLLLFYIPVRSFWPDTVFVLPTFIHSFIHLFLSVSFSLIVAPDIKPSHLVQSIEVCSPLYYLYLSLLAYSYYILLISLTRVMQVQDELVLWTLQNACVQNWKYKLEQRNNEEPLTPTN